ncbi:MAG: hypothetical protein ACTSR2_07645, partial [Candidatus Hodarchaeales archaeon]
FASRKLLSATHKLFNTSLKKEFQYTVIEDASITYYVISRNVLRAKLSTIISLNTLQIGTSLCQTIKNEKWDNLSHRLLDLLEEYVTESIKLEDPALVRAVNYYTKHYLGMIKPRELEGRERLQKRISEIAKKIKPI